MFETIKNEVVTAVTELCEIGRLSAGDILVVGCSSSEVCGSKIGSDSSPEAAEAIFEGIMSVLAPRGIFLAAIFGI